MKKNIVFLFTLIFVFLALSPFAFASGKKDEDFLVPPPEFDLPAQPGLNIQETDVNIGQSEAVPATVLEIGRQNVTYAKKMPEGNPLEFEEVWAYVLDGRENQWNPSMPITDLCYFSADVNAYGEINSVPNPKKIKGFNGRMHLVFTVTGRALTHFSLSPKYDVRNGILDVIERESKRYDGIQIDFENVPARDSGNFITLLQEIRNRIGEEKMLTVALAARTRTIADDIYPYQKIEPIVDRIIVMAYDEHWSGSKPGPVASMDWCRRVADYCVKVLPKRKIVMGLPFYGRSWQDQNYGTAWVYKSINRILGEEGISNVERKEGIPYFQFTAQVNVTGYFDDTYSLVERSRMYKDKGVRKVGFWRVGQEDLDFWSWLKISE